MFFFLFGGRWGAGRTIHPPLTLCNGLSPMRKTFFIGLLLVSRNIIKAVARLLVKGGIISSTDRRHEPCRGFWAILPHKIFKFGCSKTLFSAHEMCLRKIYVEYENGKQMQVTIITVTESRENKSIHRLNVSGSTVLGGKLSPLSPR